MAAERNGVPVRGNEVKRLRKGKSLTQEDLSEMTGITLKVIRNIETNVAYHCRQETLKKLAAFFGVEPDYLTALAASPPATC